MIRITKNWGQVFCAAAVLSFATLSEARSEIVNVDLIDSGADWRYWEDGVEPANWNQPEIDDALWLLGPTEIGFGEGDENTVLFDFEGNITAYFRHHFEVPADGTMVAAELRVRRDDGVIVYLDGVEVVRDNMPAGAVNNLTEAAGPAPDDAREWQVFSIDASLLTPGPHLLAAEVHQSSPGSGDLSFDLELDGQFEDDEPPGETYGGEGTPEDPYEIENAAQLLRLAHTPEHWGASFNVVDDVDMAAISADDWQPIGDEDTPFAGHFDGSTRTISNFLDLENGHGLFGELGAGGRVDNVFIEQFRISTLNAFRPVGALASISHGWVENCRLSLSNVSGVHRVGGLVGQSHAQLINCDIWMCDVVGEDRVGGIAGTAHSAIACSVVDIEVDGTGNRVGGVLGEGFAEDCEVVTGEVDGSRRVGGVVGQGSASGCTADEMEVESIFNSAGGIVGELTGPMTRCGFTGTVRGTDYVGGVAGRYIADGLGAGEIRECFADADVSGNNFVGGLVGFLNDSPNALVESYALGYLSGSNVGGVIGYGSETSFSNCYSATQISDDLGPFGGLVGLWSAPWGEVSASFWDMERAQTTIAASTSGEDLEIGVTGLTTPDMLSSTVFETAGWDFEEVWVSDTGSYPRLRWQGAPPEPVFAGSGTSEDPFIVVDTDGMIEISRRPALWDKHFALRADLDFEDVDLFNRRAIGSHADPFRGSFDGRGHVIVGLDIEGQPGLFGVTTGTLCNVTLIGVQVNSPWVWKVGALVGNSQGTLKNCHVIGGIISGSDDVGGLAGSASLIIDCSAQGVEVDCVGDNAGGLAGTCPHVERSWSSGNVEGEDDVGGLLGQGSVVIASYSHANVLSEEGKAGGLVGTASDNSPRIERCYATGVVATEDSGSGGGLVGILINGTIHNCFATGSVPVRPDGGNDDITGGLIGYAPGLTGVGTSFWDVETSEIDRAVGTGTPPENPLFTMPLSTAEATSAAPYLLAGWDFVGESENGVGNFWRVFPGAPDYPHLWWETIPANPDTDGDGLLDEWEIENFGDLSQTGDGDPDRDGTPNMEEQDAGTDPNDRDSDGDGLSDGLELALGSDPNDAAAPQAADVQKILPNDAGPTGEFGFDVAISRRTMVIGRPEDAFGNGGAVYIFERTMEGDVGDPPPNPSPLYGTVVISEIMYRPAGDASAEFIELLNISPNPIDLTGTRFSNGVEFTFPAGAFLPPEGRYVVTRSDYAGTLSDGGETLTLVDDADATIASVPYDDGGAWPANADGGGSSLVLRAPFTNPAADDPANWTTSTDDGGSPGSADPDAESQPATEAHPRWVQAAKLEGSGFGATKFGAVVDIHRNTIAIGAEHRVLVFGRDDAAPSGWSLETDLAPPTAALPFLPSLAVHRDTLVTRAFDGGAPVLLVFERDANGWSQIDSIPSPEPQPSDKFGVALALHRHTIVGGSACGVFVFQRNPFTRDWALVKKIEEHPDDEAAISVAVHRHTAVVGSQGNAPDGGTTLGNVYHRFAGGIANWGHIAQLPAPGEDTGLVREYDVAVRGGTIVAGARLSDTTAENAGLVYLFKRRLSGVQRWVLDRVVPPLAGQTGLLGQAVDLSGNQVVAGAPDGSQDPTVNACAYVFAVHPRHRFRDWLAHFFTPQEMDDPQIAELAADPDRDGLVNELEFALGLDPTSPDEDEDFVESLSVGVAGAPGEECLTFTFSLPEVMPAGVIYEVQVADADGDWRSLATRDVDGHWSGDGEAAEHVAEDGRICITVHDTVRMVESGTRLMRLGVRSMEP